MRHREVHNIVARISLPKLDQQLMSQLVEYDDVIRRPLFSLSPGPPQPQDQYCTDGVLAHILECARNEEVEKVVFFTKHKKKYLELGFACSYLQWATPVDLVLIMLQSLLKWWGEIFQTFSSLEFKA